VVPELIYSPHGYDGRIDLTLFLNGIPVATLELKSCFKQSLENAKKQYRFDRQLKTLGKVRAFAQFPSGSTGSLRSESVRSGDDDQARR
jgi:type I restriction enzyme R subunit